MSRPLVSVSGVFESETVHTTQRTRVGAWALCSSTGERAGVPAAAAGLRHGGGALRRRVRPVQHLDDVEHLHVSPAGAEAGGQLEDAARVRRHHGPGARGLDVGHLALEQPLRHHGLGEVVDPRRAAAHLGLAELDQLEPGHGAQERAGRAPDLLPVRQVTRVVIRRPERERPERLRQRGAREELGDVHDLPGEGRRARRPTPDPRGADVRRPSCARRTRRR